VIDVPRAIDRVLALSHADACIVIGSQEAAANIRWANNTTTTSGVVDRAVLTVMSIIGRRIASVTRTHFPDGDLEAIVRESEQLCAGRPEAPDYVPLAVPGAGDADAGAAPPQADIRALEALVPQIGRLFEEARSAGMATFGFAEHTASTVWLATSTGVRRSFSDRIGKIEITGKSPDYTRSSWAGRAADNFAHVELAALFESLRQKLSWAGKRIDMPAGAYEVLLEPSCTADLALGAYDYMARRDADEGRSPYSKAGGGTLIGERLFGQVSMYSDPLEPGIPTPPFVVAGESSSTASVFDNGLATGRTDWVRDGVLQTLIAPRYWSAPAGLAAPVFQLHNLIVPGSGPSLDQMIAETGRALLITCFWYIRPVDPQTALDTGLTRDGVFLVEKGKVVGAVNNFRWNMSSIAALAQTTQIGRSDMALPREHDEFLRTKAPAIRIERFNMSSRSDAT
jgi:predicted Zn-dependent protease